MALKHAYQQSGGHGAWMLNNAYDRALADQALADGADLIAFGKSFIANPDLAARLKQNGPYNTPDRATFMAVMQQVIPTIQASRPAYCQPACCAMGASSNSNLTQTNRRGRNRNNLTEQLFIHWPGHMFASQGIGVLLKCFVERRPVFIA